MAFRRIWIMDGHNMIFAIRALRHLQILDHREEARSGLADRLERFALARSEKVLLVFDGNESASNPDSFTKSLFEVVYTRRGAMVADDRILREARRCLERELAVTVVTDDVATLASRLPRGVQHMGVQAFWQKYIEKDEAAGGVQLAGGGKRQEEEGKRVEGDFSDVEHEMLARAAAMDPAFPGRRGRGGHASFDPKARPHATAEEALRERLRRKREKGRLRQKRLLKRRAKPAR